MNFSTAFYLVAALISTAAVSQAATPRIQEYVKLPSSNNQFIGFGDSVALNGDTVLVGGSRLGTLQRFERAEGAEDLPFAREVGGNIGSRLAFSFEGGVVAVGTAASTDGIDDSDGSVHLIDLGTGEEILMIMPEEFRDRRASFGSAVALGSGVVLVGDDGDEGFSFPASGAAYLFDAATGKQLHKLTIEENTSFGRRNYFGTAVAIEGNVAWVGASGDRIDGRLAAGSVRLFDIASGSELRTVTSDVASFQYFGRSLDTDDGMAIVGATGSDGIVRNSGAAYLFDATTGDEITKLSASDGVGRALFGHSVAIGDGLVLIGAPYDTENGDFSGAAYLFNADTGQELAKLIPSDPIPFQEFGRSVAIDNGFAVIGASTEFSLGSAYLFDLTRFIPEPTSALLTALACLAACSRRVNPGKPACVR